MSTATHIIHKNRGQAPTAFERDVTRGQDFCRKFICPEESMRYAGSLEQLVFNKIQDLSPYPTIIEFGSGTGEPVISTILRSKFSGIIHGYEINADSAETAEGLIEEHGLDQHYVIHNMSFFDIPHIPKADYLIANPPYLPCGDKGLLALPSLCGGIDGNEVSKNLLSYNYQNVFLEISSYSNPIALIEYALNQGYKISDFQITQMPFGIYSRQDVVQQRILKMKEEGKAFFTNNCYLVGSALFTKDMNNGIDLSQEFLTCLTSIGYHQNLKPSGNSAMGLSP